MTTSPDELAAIHGAAFTTPRPWSAAEIADLLAGPGVFLITEPGGFLIGRAIADEAEVLTVAVLPDIRGQGLGTNLVATFLGEARARGAATAFLEVAADNLAARTLYARAGFAETGRRRHYYTTNGGNPVDALILSRPLPPAEEKL
ncbi:MAG: ribosomal protein S18-alanine N-acetyltransferase [Albidovulum sp.]|uniref:ribosomal protein S18-alanine N-acetyltransferase n=1 Tax=Albidovulum sp. TaxID=1872424 RepID=UPI003CB60BF7